MLCKMEVSFLVLSVLFVFPATADDDVILAVLGSTVVLDCKIPQTDTLIWDRPDGTVLAIKGAVHPTVNASRFLLRNASALQSLSIHDLFLSDDGQYRCYDLTDAGRKQNFTVNIFVRPTLFSVNGPSTVIDEGSVQILRCTADGGKPPPLVQWHLLGPNTNGTTYVGHDVDTVHANGTISRVNTLRLMLDRTMYKGSVICDASIQYFYQVQQTVVLNVNLAPLAPVFDSFTGLFDDGELRSITCHSNGSRPAAKIFWMLNGVRVNSTSVQVIRNSDDTYLVRGTLIRHLTRNMENQALSCVVTNPVLEKTFVQSLNRSVVLLPNYSPSISADNGTRTVTEGSPLVLHCDIEGRPLPPPSQTLWFFNGFPILDSSFNITRVDISVSRLSTSLHVQHFHRDHSGQYSCQGYNHLGAAKSLPLNVQALYSPICSFSGVQKHAVRIGDDVSLTCQVTASPNNVTMRWRYIQSNAPIKTGLLGDVESQAVSSTTIRIDVASNNQYSDIVCIATNIVGDMMFPCMYRIVEPSPPEIPFNCSTKAVSDTSVQVECNPGFNGGSPQHFLLQMLDSSKEKQSFNTISNRSSPLFTVSGLTPGSNYTFRMCSGSSAFARTISCGRPLKVTTSAAGAVNRKLVSTPSEASTTPYIIGGVVGFLVLLILISVLAYCLHKKRKRGGNVMRSNQIPWRTNDWLKQRNGTSTGISVIPGAHNEAFEEDIVNAESNKPLNAENQQKSIDNHGNEMLRKLEEGDSIRISKLTALTLLALSKKHSSHESERKVDLDFLDEQVTDLDELSNPRSPGLVLTYGSPRRDFSYSETRLDTINPGNKALETELNTQLSEETKQMSKSSHVLSEVTPSSEKSINDYINLSYPDRNLKNTVNENESIKEDMEAIKKTFVSRYSLQFQAKNDDSPSLIQNSPASSTSSVSGAGSLRGAPRRQSYTLAISSDEEGATLAREVLSASFICKSSIYDVPRNSGGFEVDEFKTESKETDSEDRASVNANYEITDRFTSVKSGQKKQLDNSALSLVLNRGVERGNITQDKENSSLNHDETKSDLSNEQRDSIGAYF